MLAVILVMVLANVQLIFTFQVINVSHVMKDYPQLLDRSAPSLVNAQLTLISRMENVLPAIKENPRLLDRQVLMHAKKEMEVGFSQYLGECTLY